jgi:hypothetical protein
MRLSKRGQPEFKDPSLQPCGDGMNPWRPKFTISQLMILVGIVAVLLWMTHSGLGALVLSCLLAFCYSVYRVSRSGPPLPRRIVVGDGRSGASKHSGDV